MATEGKTDKQEQDEQLGEGGLRALKAEREENRDLREQLRLLKADLQTEKDKELSERDAAIKRAERAEAEVKQYKERDQQNEWRNQVADEFKDHEIPVDLISGDNLDSMRASATKLKDHFEKVNGPRTPEPNPHLGQNQDSGSDDGNADALSVLGFAG